MNIFRLAFELLALYLLYKFIFEFVIPIYRSTKTMKNSMRNMQEKMQEMHKQQAKTTETNPIQPQKQAAPKEDYIDYEEIK
ncbi:MAG: hypothetical protein ABIW38_13110 [Ferruginibacter sp.]